MPGRLRTSALLRVASRAANRIPHRSRRTAISCRGTRASTPKSSQSPCKFISRINVRAVLTERMYRLQDPARGRRGTYQQPRARWRREPFRELIPLAFSVPYTIMSTPCPSSRGVASSEYLDTARRALLLTRPYSGPNHQLSPTHCETQLTIVSLPREPLFPCSLSALLSAHAIVFCSLCLYPCTILSMSTISVPVTSSNQCIMRNWVFCRDGRATHGGIIETDQVS